MLAEVVPLSSGRDAAVNRAAVTSAVASAATRGARLVVLPEYSSTFDPRGVDPSAAEPLEGPFVTLLEELTAGRDLAVLAGTVVPGSSSDRAVNAAVLVDGGHVRGVYRKVHLYDAFGQRESDRFEAGAPEAEPLVVELDGLRVGVMTCYDLRFPESARRLVDAGATVLAVPAAWAAGEHKADQWETLLRARAIESCAYVLGAAQTGPGVTGRSVVVDPQGILLSASEGPVAASAELDPSLVASVRDRNPALSNRRYVVVPGRPCDVG